MGGNRSKLRNFYLVLCVSQMAVMGMGLTTAYQVERSYSLNIDYERIVNAERQRIDELEILVHAASPEAGFLDDNTSGPDQLSEVAYAANVFIRKAQEFSEQIEHSRDSPLAKSQTELRAMITQMNMVAEQSRLAGEAWAEKNDALARARLTYADRSAQRVHTILGDLNQQMSKAKEVLLSRDSEEARRARFGLGSLSVAGIFLVFPALFYVRRLNKNIWAYELELENERKFLEERVSLRTAELRSEIVSRERIESFNSGRNRLLEKVAEGKDLDEVLTQLVHATEQSVEGSRCLILLNNVYSRSVIAPNVSSVLAAQLRTSLLECWDKVSLPDAANRCAMFVKELNVNASIGLGAAWSEGFQIVLAVPLAEQPQQPLLGVVVLLLGYKTELQSFAREVLLSASRVASVALQHERMQNELFRRAHFDPLTDLPNRVLFEDRLQQAIALAGRRNSQVGVLCIDLDEFKQVNDSYGHHAGDSLLQQVSQRLTSNLRKMDTVARLGGDEFAAIVHDTHDGDGVAKVGEAFVRLLADEPYLIGDTVVRATASIGGAIFPADGTTCSDLRRRADLALYRAKERGRNTFQIFSSDLGERLEKRKQIEGHLRKALDGAGFELHYQPIYTMSRVLIGFEALIRFRNTSLQKISPAEFIPVAEQAGLVPQIGDWVVREACRQAKEWQQAGIPAMPIAVNVSAIQLARPNFSERVAQALQETGLDAKWLHVEVTETAIMCDFEAGLRALNALSALGVRIAIDDFGTGYSSLSYIHRLPIKAVKIDRSFVQEIVRSQESRAIIRAIIAMAQSLELTVVAEGVETEEQWAAVCKSGCNAAQGYMLSRPLDTLAVRDLLTREFGYQPTRTLPVPAASAEI